MLVVVGGCRLRAVSCAALNSSCWPGQKQGSTRAAVWASSPASSCSAPNCSASTSRIWACLACRASSTGPHPCSNTPGQGQCGGSVAASPCQHSAQINASPSSDGIPADCPHTPIPLAKWRAWASKHAHLASARTTAPKQGTPRHVHCCMQSKNSLSSASAACTGLGSAWTCRHAPS